MPEWTREQREAIDARGARLLVSAAAGSGKTTVMVERILSLIGQGADVTRMLIVTFTRAAAGKMRVAIADKLAERAQEEPERFGAQVEQLELAQISTIHSFLSALLRERFEAADIDPGFRVCDDIEEESLYARAREAAQMKAYEAGGEAFEQLAAGHTPDEVMALADEAYRFLMARADGLDWLDGQVERLANGQLSEYFDALAGQAREEIRSAIAMLKAARAECALPEGPDHYIPSIETDIDRLQSLCGGDYGAIHSALAEFSFTNLKTKRDAGGPHAENAKALRDRAKRMLEEAGKLVLIDPETGAADARLSAIPMSALSALVRMLDDELRRLKSARRVLSFNDLEHCALKVLSDEHTAAAVRSKFDYIFVDEYQDVSELQERIIERISGEDNLFMVGDVKQSIYRFRQAEPTLFLEKSREYQPGEGNKRRRIDLMRNFRSRASVLEFTNALFAREMDGGGREILYDDAAALIPGREFPGEEPEIELNILLTARGGAGDTDEEEGDEPFLSSADQEARHIARRAREMLGQTLPGMDRPVEPRDIVVLMRSARGSADTLVSQLLALGIPAYADVGGGYFDVFEVRTLLMLLSIIDNRLRDAPLIAVMRAPFMGFDTEELARIRAFTPTGGYAQAAERYAEQMEDALAEKLRGLMVRLEGWRRDARVMDLAELIWKLMIDTQYMAFVGALPGGAQRQANLSLLVERAQQYDASQQDGLPGFLRHVERLRAQADKQGEAATLTEADNVVRVMTAHKAKGLEFPVVICARLGARIRRGERGMTRQIAFHPRLGAGMRYVDEALYTMRDTPPRLAIARRAQSEEFAEELRILYVMLTRAQYKLILVGRVAESQLENLLLCAAAGEARALKPASFLDMILAAAARMPGGEALLEPLPGLPAPGVIPGAPRVEVRFEQGALGEGVLEDAPDTPLPEAEEWAVRALREALAYEYPFDQATLMPLKLTVSALARELEGPAELPELKRMPQFEGEAVDSAALGTAAHSVMSHIPLCPPPEDGRAYLNAQTEALARRGVISDMEARAMPLNSMARFLDCELWRRACKAEEVHREWPFTLRMSAREALGQDNDETMLVQGMIDLCFMEEGGWVLVDYKTDREADEDIARVRHGRQLALYARALAQITGLPVRERLIVLLRHGVVAQT